VFDVDVARRLGMRWLSRLALFRLAGLASINVLAIFALTAHSAAVADDEDVITYRQLIMKQLDAQAAALGMIVAGQISADTLTLQSKALANSAKSALKAFELNVPGGESKPEVWSKREDFAKLMQTFVRKSEEMAKASETGNTAQAAELMIDALNCKQCHDTFRIKKKNKAPGPPARG
jgi:cytochrome c556